MALKEICLIIALIHSDADCHVATAITGLLWDLCYFTSVVENAV